MATKKKQSNRQYAEALYELTEGLSGNALNETLEQFAALLARRQKIKQADKILAEYVRVAKKRAGVLEINIQTARPVDKVALEKIKSAFGKKVEATATTNSDLLGGVVIRTDDKILDGSIKTQLSNLKNFLINK